LPRLAALHRRDTALIPALGGRDARPAVPPVSSAFLGAGLLGLDGVVCLAAPALAGGAEAAWVAAVLFLALTAAAGGYAPRAVFSPRRQIGAVLAGGAGAVLAVAAVHAGVSRWDLGVAAVTLGCLVIGRLGVAALIAGDARRRLAPRAVIVGRASDAARVAALLERREGPGLRVLGFAADPPGAQGDGLACLGPVEAALRLVRRGEVEQVVLALPWSAGERIREILDGLAEHPVQVRLAPDPMMPGFGASPVVTVQDRPISGWGSLLKRVEDVVFALLLLAVFALPMAAIALAVRLDSPGPVLFRQRRVGFGNREFRMLKFRTMLHAPGAPLLQAAPGDARITRVGAWLRRTSADELPQLINVLRGEMSLVGPRPHAPGTTAGGRRFEEVAARYAARHLVRPGMTGLAQVRGLRGPTETEDKLVARVRSDLEYIESWSLGLDLLIVAWTAVSVVRMKNAW